MASQGIDALLCASTSRGLTGTGCLSSLFRICQGVRMRCESGHPLQALELRRDAQLQPAAFQQLWGRLQACQPFEIPLSVAGIAAIQQRQQASLRTPTVLLRMRCVVSSASVRCVHAKHAQHLLVFTRNWLLASRVHPEPAAVEAEAQDDRGSQQTNLCVWMVRSSCSCLSAQEFCRAMGARGVVRVASGGNPIKFYFHAQPAGSPKRLLLEVLGDAAGLKVTIKAEDASLAEPLQRLFVAAVAGFL